MDKKEIRKALDAFEDDKYTDASDIIKKEIAGKRNEFLKDKLGLEESLNPMIDEDATADAKKTLQAIMGSLKDDKENEIYKMADSMMKSYEKNKGFSKDQAQWIYNTSKSMFK